MSKSPEVVIGSQKAKLLREAAYDREQGWRKDELASSTPPTPLPTGHPTTSGAAQPQGQMKRRMCPSLLMNRNGGNSAHWSSHGQGWPKSAHSGEIGIVPVGVMKCTTLRIPLLAYGLKVAASHRWHPLSPRIIQVAGPAQGNLL